MATPKSDDFKMAARIKFPTPKGADAIKYGTELHKSMETALSEGTVTNFTARPPEPLLATELLDLQREMEAMERERWARLMEGIDPASIERRILAGIQAKHDYFHMKCGEHSHTIQAPPPTPDQGGYYPTIQEAMKRALAAKRAGIRPTAIVDEDDEPEIQVVTVKYVICMTCGAGMTKEAFYFEGAKMNHCHCKLGEERWEIVSKPQRVGERPKTVIAPAPR